MLRSHTGCRFTSLGFLFFPRFAAFGPARERALSDLVKRLDRTRCATTLVEENRLLLKSYGLQFEIALETGIVWLEHAYDPEQWFEESLFHAKEAEFFDLFQDAQGSFPEQWAKSARELGHLGNEVLYELRQRFSVALKSGAAAVYARPDSPLRPFKRIYPDQWQFFEAIFEEDDEGNDVVRRALGPNGETLYNPFIEPLDQEPAALPRAARLKRLTADLSRMMRDSPDQATMTNDEITSWAKENYGSDIGRDTVLTCKASAIKSTGAKGWLKSGPR